MKKILMAIALIACLVLPLSAMAKSTLADNELSTVTGQAGVSINVDISANITVGTLAWGDSDGISNTNFGNTYASTYTSAGYVGIDGLTMALTVAGRLDGPFMMTSAGNVGYLRNHPITIDVGTNSAGLSLVKIGLPTFHITVGTLDMNIFLAGDAGQIANGTKTFIPSTSAVQSLGEIYIAGVDLKLGTTTDTSTATTNAQRDALARTYDAGYVTLATDTAGVNQGVKINFDVKIDSLTLGTVSYGNTSNILSTTSFAAATGGGFIGLTGLTIRNMEISGGVAIGIGHLNGVALGAGNFGDPTMVNIMFRDGLNITMPNAITGTIILAQNKQLTTTASELGNFYVGGVTISVPSANAGSVVTHPEYTGTNAGTNLSETALIQIWAH